MYELGEFEISIMEAWRDSLEDWEKGYVDRAIAAKSDREFDGCVIAFRNEAKQRSINPNSVKETVSRMKAMRESNRVGSNTHEFNEKMRPIDHTKPATKKS